MKTNQKRSVLDDIAMFTHRVRGPLPKEVRIPDEEESGQWKWQSSHWIVTLSLEGRNESFHYYMGSALKGSPVKGEVLDSLESDATSASETFHDFRANLGYDDTDQTRRIYFECQRNGSRLRSVLGSHYGEFQKALGERA